MKIRSISVMIILGRSIKAHGYCKISRECEMHWSRSRINFLVASVLFS